MDAPRLYSYCIPYDDGAAPNPFWGYCTLAICKPAIRRSARINDWIVGTGSKRHGLEGRVVYAMRVSDKLPLREYDAWARRNSPKRIPHIHSSDIRRHVGDAIYDFSTGRAAQRKGVHVRDNIKTDLSGKNALISDHFYYFGASAPLLPASLRPIINQRQGHKVRISTPHLKSFLRWLKRLDVKPNRLHGRPAGFGVTAAKKLGCKIRKRCSSAELKRPHIWA